MDHQASITKALRDAIAHTGRTVTYRRGDASAEVPMAPTRPDRRLVKSGEILVQQAADMDWLVEAALLVLDDQVVTPGRGDRVEDAGAGTYEVLSIAGEDCYRPMDATATFLRIHTKRVRAT